MHAVTHTERRELSIVGRSIYLTALKPNETVERNNDILLVRTRAKVGGYD
jgi:hypothetical protein